jgi:hypothetical protein
MKTLHKIYIIGAITLLTINGCKNKGIIYTTAMVLNTGIEAADGCGWMIKTNGKLYKPSYLSEQFQKDSLTVNIKYRLIGTLYQCGLNPDSKYEKIKIEEIK